MKNDLSIYSTHADGWWDGSQRWMRTLHKLVPARLAVFDPLVGNWEGKRVLDLGCGGGYMAEALARLGARVVGLDPSEKAVESARRHAEATGLTIDYQVGVGESLPLPDASFDCVVCVDVLEHVADLRAVLHESQRVLKPGGLFLFDTINRTYMAWFVVIFLGESVLRLLLPGTHDYRLFLKPGELRLGLSQAGLVPGSFAGLGPRGLDRRLDFTFGWLPTTHVMYIGHAKKPSGHGAPTI